MVYENENSKNDYKNLGIMEKYCMSADLFKFRINVVHIKDPLWHDGNTEYKEVCLLCEFPVFISDSDIFDALIGKLESMRSEDYDIRLKKS